jgi:hypothetical protein
MTWPTDDIDPTHLDSGADKAGLARTALLALVQGYNSMRNHVSSFMRGVLAANSDSTARSALSAAKSGTNNDITSITGLTTPLTNAQGGTGRGTLTAGSLLVGAGTDPVALLAPGADGKQVGCLSGAFVLVDPPSSGVSSVNGKTGAVSTVTVDSVGCYMFLAHSVAGTSIASGSTYAGTLLRKGYTPAQGIFSNSSPLTALSSISGTAVSGTWRAMCPANGTDANGNVYAVALFAKVSD